MRAMFRILGNVGMLIAAAPVSAQQPLTASLSFVSDPGDYIGGGQSRMFTLDTASFSVRGGQNGGYVGVTVFPFTGGFWFLDLAAPQGTPLAPGPYEGAARYPFQASGQPGLSLTGDGRGCNTVTGRFTVVEAEFGPNNYVVRFHATFEQHCEGGTAALLGEIQIVNPPPPPPLGITLTITSPGRVDRVTGNVQVTGTVSCTVATSVSVNAALTQRLTRFALARATAFQFLACSPTPALVTLNFTPSGNVPFGSGWAQLDVVSSGFDSYYGNFVSVPANGALKLLPSR
jgi:hypothetical protein